MNNFQNQHWNNSSATANTQQNNQQTSQQANQQQTNFQEQSNAQTQQPPSILMKLMGSCLPVLLEQFTGQSMSPMGGGNNVEMQLALSQVISLQQQILVGQQSLEQRLTQLENNASQQLLGLAQEIKSIKSIRLSHERESKRIEFNGNYQQQQEN